MQSARALFDLSTPEVVKQVMASMSEMGFVSDSEKSQTWQTKKLHKRGF
jgi:hypothetical protein